MARGPANKFTTEFEENTIEIDCLCLLLNLVVSLMMSRRCHGMENEIPEGADEEMTD